MFKNILVPVDLAVEASQSAVAAAVALTKATKDARITLLNVIAPTSPVVTQYLPEDWAEQANARAQARLKEIAKANGLADGQVRLRHGVVYDEILTEARDAGCDLVIMASHHPVISDYLLGSNAATVVRHADCSVLVLRD